MNPGPSSTLIIGVGNVYRGDDGVGIVVASRLRACVPTGVRVIEENGEGGRLLDAWKDMTNVLLVDAVHSGAPPGTIHRLDARLEPVPRRFFHYSTHAFSVAEAVELGRALNQLPARLILYGIEGEKFSPGEALSAEVEGAISALIDRVLNEARSWLGGVAGTPTRN